VPERLSRTRMSNAYAAVSRPFTTLFSMASIDRNGPQMTMPHKLHRTIAVLEAEAKMLEAHAERLSIMARQMADPEHQREIIKLSHEETEKAEGIRRQIRLLKGHL
jgi:hypothetical protein